MSDRERWMAAAHAVQTGVAAELAKDPASGSPKHLRTGVNLVMADHGSLARLLIEKGLITEAEYLKAIADGAERERDDVQRRLTEMYGLTVKLV